MTLGEGSAILVLEDMEVVAARGVDILGEIVGFGMSSDAAHMTQPKPDGPAAAMSMALRDSGALRCRVEYINAHGTGTVANDAAEAAAIRSVFGVDANHIAVSSTKSVHGHTMGASGAIEALATVAALRRGLLPINAGIGCADPALGIDVVIAEPRRKHASMALSNSLAFGGLNAVLAFRPYGGS